MSLIIDTVTISEDKWFKVTRFLYCLAMKRYKLNVILVFLSFQTLYAKNAITTILDHCI